MQFSGGVVGRHNITIVTYGVNSNLKHVEMPYRPYHDFRSHLDG